MLEKNMSISQMKSFLSEELKEQILLEIAPILHVGINQGGYFGVSRQILCLINFISALYYGYDENDDKKFKETKGKERKIEKSSNAIKFIEEVMGESIDPFYKVNGEKLYKMYRHGLVHLYQPKTFRKKDGKLLGWFAYKGSREKHIQIIDGVSFADVRHMSEVTDPRDSNVLYLAVSITCLYYDLIQVIDMYNNLLDQDKDLQARWISTANAIWEAEQL